VMGTIVFRTEDIVRRARLAPLAALIVLLTAGPAHAIQEAKITADSEAKVEDLCVQEIDRVELAERVPRALMRAIAVTESGRWIEGRQANFAWPWTINVDGEGRFFPTKAAAVAEVKRLRANGKRSIDVGCMQVNLHFHPKAFASIEDAFDPVTNVAYAAKYLRELQQLRKSWADAVAYYHSATAEYNIPYREKVYKNWAVERKRAYDDERAKIIAAYAERRAELDRQREAQRKAHEQRQAEAEARMKTMRALAAQRAQAIYNGQASVGQARGDLPKRPEPVVLTKHPPREAPRQPTLGLAISAQTNAAQTNAAQNVRFR